MPAGEEANAQCHPAGERQVRVFISSTFRDMHAERDHLVTVVFPELRERVEQLGLEFFDVDLRWGVPAKDLNGETANSWEYCRQWIDRVEPFFVCMLGQRYGWEPEPEQLKAEDDRERQRDNRRSITDMEVRHAVLNTKLKRRSYFYLRATSSPTTASEFVDPPPLLLKLEQLKREVRSCGRPVRDYPCQWTGSGYVGMDDFGRCVLEDLWSGVLRDERYVNKQVWRRLLGADPDADPRYTDESQPVPRELWERIVAVAKPAPAEPLDAEREQMDAFVAARLKWFHGRTHELQQLTDFAQSVATDAPRLAVVQAVPGQGKSALLAKLSTVIANPSTILITHFVGATERSADVYALVQRLLGELDRSGIPWPADTEQERRQPRLDFRSLCLRLAQRLGDYAGERQIVILIDALNQLSDGHDLQWLPSRLGSSVRVIVSCVEDATPISDRPEQRVLRSLASRLSSSFRVPLGRLTEGDVRMIVVEYLAEYCHELDRDHLETLCAIPQVYNPLYLLVMLNELRTLGGNDLNHIVPAHISSMAQDHPDTVSLFRWVLQRLEVFGPEAVRWWCLYLALGRAGLASHELADLLARKLGAASGSTALRIERGLRRYLLRRSSQLDFFHGQLRQAVFEQYGRQADATAVHSEIATYFRDLADPIGDGSWTGQYLRSWSEFAFHLFNGGHRTELRRVLMDYLWMRGRLRATDVMSLIGDYDLLDLDRNDPLAIVQGALRLSAHVLARDSDQLTSQLYGRLRTSSSQQSASPGGLSQPRASPGWFDKVRGLLFKDTHEPPIESIDRSPSDDPINLLLRASLGHQRPCLRPLRPCLAPSGSDLLVTLQGHENVVYDLAVTPDGHRAISRSSDKTLRIWDIRSGLELWRIQDNAKMNITDDYTGVVSVTRYIPLAVWDLACGRPERTLSQNNGEIAESTVTLDGQRSLLAFTDGTIEDWDLEKGRLLQSFKIPSERIAAIALTGHNRRMLITSRDGTFAHKISVWDLEAQRETAVIGPIEISEDKVKAMAVTSDGKILLLPTRYDRIDVWNLRSGRFIRRLEGHELTITAIVVTLDGKYAISSSRDKTLKVWHLRSGRLLRTLVGHTDAITALAVSADGRSAVSGSSDKTLRVWDLESGRSVQILEGHLLAVTAVAITSGDRYAISASRDKTLKVWDLEHRTSGDAKQPHGGPITAVSMTADGRFAVSACHDGTLAVWNVEKGTPTLTLESNQWTCTAVALTPDGKYFLSGSHDYTLKVWNLETGAQKCILKGHTGKVLGVAVTPDGRRAVSASADHSLIVWDLDEGTMLRRVGRRIMSMGSYHEGDFTGTNNAGHVDVVRAVAVSPNGRFAVSASRDRTLAVWDIESGQLVRKIEGCGDKVNSLSISADGRRLISVSYEEPIKSWDVDKGQLLHSPSNLGEVMSLGEFISLQYELVTERRWLRGGAGFILKMFDIEQDFELRTVRVQAEAILGVAVSSNSSHAISASGNHFLKVWSINNGACLSTFTGEAAFLCCACSADGRTIVAGDERGDVAFFVLDGAYDVPLIVNHDVD